MTSSVIFKTTSLLLVTLFLVFSFFLLWRGHDEPGGGFAGGLMAAAAFALYTIAYGAPSARENLLVDSRYIIAAGLALATVSGIPALLVGDPFMRGLWIDIDLAGRELKVGTPLLFDVGVYLTVLGVVATIVFALAEEED